MNKSRRELLINAIGMLLLGWIPLKLRPKSLESAYFFDWTQNPPYTNHPDYKNKLTRCGKHQKVLLDGEDVGPVFCCVTGSKGWIRIFKFNSDGDPFHYPGIPIETLYGNVEYVCPIPKQTV